jgi:predicted ATPase
LRQESNESSGSLGMGGEKLSAYLYDLPKDDKKHIASKLQRLYPRLKEFKATAKKSGEKQLEIVEQYEGNSLKTGARHVNDGLLRMMAVFSQLKEDQSFLLFDEIENGINPELVEALVDELVSTKQQVLITTHSPMILNYLEDDVAKSGITYLYKNKKGHTQAIKLFDIPSMAKKLEFMGPGEAFVDTDLSKLADEIFDQEEA